MTAPPALAALPAARGVLAVVERPGDESGYLGAVLDAFRLAGARSVRRAGGLAVTGGRSVDVEIRVRRSTQRRAMRAHRSQVREDRVRLARLAIQGDREWLRRLVP